MVWSFYYAQWSGLHVLRGLRKCELPLIMETTKPKRGRPRKDAAEPKPKEKQSDYMRRRLAKERPDLWVQVESESMTLNAAVVAAGWRKAPEPVISPLDKAKEAVGALTLIERMYFFDWFAELNLAAMAEIDARRKAREAQARLAAGKS